MVNCPFCQLSIDETPELAGQAVACPRCHNQFQMPQVLQAIPTPPMVQPTVTSSASSYCPPPKKSSKQTMMVFGAILAVIGFMGTTAANLASRAANQLPKNQVRPSAGPIGPATKGSPRVTLAAFERVQLGMRLYEVTAILGSDYEQTGPDNYVWAATNIRGVCHVTLQDGAVVRKSQSNLP